MNTTEATDKTKHTPGPWSLPHFAKPDVNCQCGYVLTGGMMGAVCTVYASGEGGDWAKHGDNPNFEEAVANAHLISKAPELLAALKEQVDQCFDPNCEMCARHEALIAEAEGAP